MITFNKEDIDFEFNSYLKLEIIISKIIVSKKYITGNINYIFTSDKYLLEINKQFLSHNYFTDIITFNYNKNKTVSADIYISIETVISNSKEFNTTFENEFLRVVFHGILHLIGYDDKNDNDQKEMTIQEESSLRLYYCK